MHANFERILKLAKKYSYFDPILSKSKNTIKKLQSGHSGSTLREQIKAEWLRSNVLNRDVQVQLYVSDEAKTADENLIRTSLLNAPDCSRRLPFGVAEIFIDKIAKEDKITSPEDAYFKFITSTIMSSTVVLSADDAARYFLYWQRLRKLWWKKIASDPGRFKLTELQVSSNDASTVSIHAEFPWGNQNLETISLSPFQEKIPFDIGTKNPMIVCNKMSLDVAIVGLYCDAFYVDSRDKITLKLNRKISPYKCVLAVDSKDPDAIKELSQLTLHLSKQLRKSNLATVLLSDCTNIAIDLQFNRNDEWGIPYTVVLNANTLKTGIVGLRNRDTTLQEEVHVSDLTKYNVLLFNIT